MSVRVNLLPKATRHRQRAARTRVQAVAGVAVLALGVLGAYAVQLQRVDQARLDRDAAQNHLAALRADVNGMQEFSSLAQEHDHAMDALRVGLGREISFAGILQDLATVTPASTALETVDVIVADDVVLVGDASRRSVARLIVTGETLHGVAPGVEGFLYDLSRLGMVSDTYLTNVATDEAAPDVPRFTVEADLLELAMTQRYRDGLPEELR